MFSADLVLNLAPSPKARGRGLAKFVEIWPYKPDEQCERWAFSATKEGHVYVMFQGKEGHETILLQTLQNIPKLRSQKQHQLICFDWLEIRQSNPATCSPPPCSKHARYLCMVYFIVPGITHDTRVGNVSFDEVVDLIADNVSILMFSIWYNLKMMSQ